MSDLPDDTRAAVPAPPGGGRAAVPAPPGGGRAAVPDLPDDFPLVERDAVRVVVVDSTDRVLLFHTHELIRPEFGTWWELPGGGLDPGETYREAAVRELAEETGIRIDPSDVGPPTWRRSATYLFRAERRLQHEVVVAVRLPHPGRAIDGSGRLPFEQEDYFDFRWWPVGELVASGERFYPGRLPALLPAFLAGERIDEPFERWS